MQITKKNQKIYNSYDLIEKGKFYGHTFRELLFTKNDYVEWAVNSKSFKFHEDFLELYREVSSIRGLILSDNVEDVILGSRLALASRKLSNREIELLCNLSDDKGLMSPPDQTIIVMDTRRKITVIFERTYEYVQYQEFESKSDLTNEMRSWKRYYPNHIIIEV